MAFTHFTNGSIGYASQVNDNFYFIADGDRLPVATTTMGYTTGVYNIGATATTWANLYANNVYCSNINITGSITSSTIKHIIASYGPDTGTSFEITGLDGDIHREYCIEFEGNPASNAYLGFFFNGDTSTNYYRQYNGGADSSGQSYCSALVNKGTLKWLITIYAASGFSRKIISELYSVPDTTTTGDPLLYYIGCVWDNSSDNLTSIKFVSTATLTSAKMIVWKC